MTLGEWCSSCDLSLVTSSPRAFQLALPGIRTSRSGGLALVLSRSLRLGQRRRNISTAARQREGGGPRLTQKDSLPSRRWRPSVTTLGPQATLSDAGCTVSPDNARSNREPAPAIRRERAGRRLLYLQDCSQPRKFMTTEKRCSPSPAPVIKQLCAPDQYERDRTCLREELQGIEAKHAAWSSSSRALASHLRNISPARSPDERSMEIQGINEAVPQQPGKRMPPRSISGALGPTGARRGRPFLSCEEPVSEIAGLERVFTIPALCRSSANRSSADVCSPTKPKPPCGLSPCHWSSGFSRSFKPALPPCSPQRPSRRSAETGAVGVLEASPFSKEVRLERSQLKRPTNEQDLQWQPASLSLSPTFEREELHCLRQGQ